MKVVLFWGGLGTRIREYSQKLMSDPMVTKLIKTVCLSPTACAVDASSSTDVESWLR